MEKEDLITQYNDDLINELASLNEDNPIGKYLVNEISKGKNSVVSKILQESKVFDSTWIDTLESYFPSLDKIIRNPRSAIKNINEVVEADRAKNISSESIRHLAAHSEYIREVKPETEEVIPSKILTTFREQDLGIYENRFIKTLINRLYFFVTKRYEVVKNDYKSYTRNILEFDTDYKLEDATVNCNFKLDIKSGTGNEKLNEKNADLVRRIENLADLISGYRISPFMKEMEKEKEVLPPIMKTNIILKNPDFRNCYLLWLFIDRYTSIGYDVSAREKNLVINDEYKEQLINLAMITYVSNQAYNPNRDMSYDTPDFKEKMLRRLKQKSTGELNIELKPKDIMLENTLITEAFLKEASKLFDKSFEEDLKNGDDPSVALKKTIKQMLEVVNHIYKSMFEIPEETQDVFKQLMETTKKSDEEFIKEYKQKIRIMRDVISAKEQDLKSTKKEMAKMEKNLAKHLANIEKAKAKEAARLAAIKKKEEEKLRREAEKQKAKEEALRLKELEKQKALEEKEKARIALQKQKEKEKAKLAAKKAREREKAKLLAEKKKQQEREKALLEKQKAKEEAARLKELEKQKALEEKEKQKQEELRIKEEERLRKEQEEKARLLIIAEKAKEKSEEQKKLDLELERKKQEEELLALVKTTKDLARDAELTAKQTEQVVGTLEEKEDKNDVKDLNIEEIKEIVDITKKIADDTENISSHVDDIIDDVTEAEK